MAYSELAALQQRMPAQTLIDLTDDAGAGAVDEDVVDRAIADADAEIDSYLVGRYAVPVDPVLPMVRLLSLNISVETLYGRRPELDMPEAVKTAAKNARALLAKISAKDAHLPGVAEVDKSGSAAAGAVFSGNGRLFTRESLKGM